ncbi:MAG: FliH/SctL family protein [Planctomycetota bacterium]
MTSWSADHTVLFHAPPAVLTLRVVEAATGAAPPLPGEIPTEPDAVAAAIEAAHRAGFENGLREGANRSNRSWSSLFTEIIESLMRGIEHLRYEARAALRESELPLVELALQAAESIVHQEIDASNYDVTAIVKEALSSLEGDDFEIVLRLNPRDLASLETAAKGPDWPSRVRLAADAGIAPAGARLEWGKGSLPVEVATRIQALREFLLAGNSLRREQQSEVLERSCGGE